MVCCALISMFLAGLIWPVRTVLATFKSSALEWRPAGYETASKDNGFSVSARLHSFRFAFSGLGFVIKNEHNARIHVVAAAAVIVVGALLQISRIDWMILCVVIGSVWFAELINSAFEYVCDIVSPEKNEKVARAKDIAAGAVLITAGFAAIIGAIIFTPYVASLIGNENLFAAVPICRG